MRNNLIGLALILSLCGLSNLAVGGAERPVVCQVDLKKDTFEMSPGAPMRWVTEPRQGQAVLELSMKGYRKARFVLTFADPSGWVLNVADSSTCNGYGGDAGTQSNDAEVQIVGRTLSVWGNDRLIGRETHKLYEVPDFASGTVTLEIANESVSAGTSRWTGPELFALAGQPDREGPVNDDIYAGFNTVVSGGRTGQGLTLARVELVR